MPMTTYIVSKTPKIATMRLYGSIGEKVDGDLFASELASLDETCDRIKLRINSGGGNVDQGFSIISVMLSMTTPVDVYIDGLSASMAAVIAVCAEKVYMMDFAQMMIHDPSFSDDSKLTSKQKEILNLTKLSLQKILSRRGCEENRIGELMTKETWFSAQQAKDAGLCDEIIASTRNNLKNIAPSILEARITAEYKPINTKEKMSYEKIASKLNLPKNSDETTIVTALDAQESTLASREKAIIDHYLKLGTESEVITDKNREKYERLAKADFDLFVDQVSTQSKAVENPVEKSDKRLSEVINNITGGDQPKKEVKTWQWYQKNDPTHLDKLESSNPKEFKRLLDEYENSL